MMKINMEKIDKKELERLGKLMDMSRVVGRGEAVLVNMKR